MIGGGGEGAGGGGLESFFLSIKFDPRAVLKANKLDLPRACYYCENRTTMTKNECLGLRVLINLSYKNVPRWIREITGHLKTQEMCDEAARIGLRSLAHVPDRFKTEDMFSEAVVRDAYTLDNVPDHIMTQKICNEAMREKPAAFFLVPNHFITQKCVSRSLK